MKLRQLIRLISYANILIISSCMSSSLSPFWNFQANLELEGW